MVFSHCRNRKVPTYLRKKQPTGYMKKKKWARQLIDINNLSYDRYLSMKQECWITHNLADTNCIYLVAWGRNGALFNSAFRPILVILNYGRLFHAYFVCLTICLMKIWFIKLNNASLLRWRNVPRSIPDCKHVSNGLGFCCAGSFPRRDFPRARVFLKKSNFENTTGSGLIWFSGLLRV